MKLASWMVAFLLWQVMSKRIAVQGGALWWSARYKKKKWAQLILAAFG